MSVELAQEHFTWNSEAVERCTVLSTEGSCPAHVRRLFHAVGPQQAPNSCLLQQISRLIMGGLTSSVDACLKASEASYGVASAGSAVRSSIAKAASAVSYHAVHLQHHSHAYIRQACTDHVARMCATTWLYVLAFALAMCCCQLLHSCARPELQQANA